MLCLRASSEKCARFGGFELQSVSPLPGMPRSAGESGDECQFCFYIRGIAREAPPETSPEIQLPPLVLLSRVAPKSSYLPGSCSKKVPNLSLKNPDKYWPIRLYSTRRLAHQIYHFYPPLNHSKSSIFHLFDPSLKRIGKKCA